MITLTKAQSEIAKDRHRFRVVNCGRRFGKTTLSVMEIIGKAYSKRDSKICYIAPTYQQARDIAWQDLKRGCEAITLRINDSRLEITVSTQDGGTSTIYLRGWEAIETLRGQRFDFLVIDEIASMRSFWLQWEEVLRPTLTDRKGDALFISTPKGFNHFYDLYNKQATDRDYISFHFTSFDNPHLPVEELNKAKEELPEDRFAQEYLADFRKQQGLVYKEFSRERHLFNPDEVKINSQEKIGGIDFGYTNPCAIIHIVRDYDSNYWVVDEYYQTQKTDAQIAEYAGTCGFNKVYPDPESPSAIAELRKKGIPVRDVVKNKDSIKNGIDKVRELFITGKLKISQKCVNLIWELETYSYPDKKELRNEEEAPIKENDHALDALRYALYMQNDGQRVKSRQHIPASLGIQLRPNIN
jgi:PBSX family phage terminase large subunit